MLSRASVILAIMYGSAYEITTACRNMLFFSLKYKG
jgi:hypothetical protein